MGGRIYGPYTGTTFSSTGETDIEHIVAKAEAHDSGLCSASAQTRRTFSNYLLNLTLASPSVNRHQKTAKDFAEWRPALNQCWFADAIIKVKAKYRLTVDSREKAALERTLLSCSSVSMIFSGAARSAAPTAAPARQLTPKPARAAQQQPPANNQNQQPAGGDWRQWDTNGNGRITCAEARQHGIAPVHRGHPAYPRMNDRDNDGVVCE
ncbi:MAG: excalibur calcium-binding domain-containing protein [Chloroflexi bacterium]|nr:excalibur calcium-binding domain-containing protein [Chloroflexota bacterium]